MSIYSSPSKQYKNTLIQSLNEFGIKFDLDDNIKLITVFDIEDYFDSVDVLYCIKQAFYAALDALNIDVLLTVDCLYCDSPQMMTVYPTVCSVSEKKQITVVFNQHFMNFIDLENVPKVLKEIHSIYHDLGD